MIFSLLFYLHAFFALCGCLALAATNFTANSTSTVNPVPTQAKPFSSATPAPGVSAATGDPTLPSPGVSAATDDPTLRTGQDSPVTTSSLSVSEASTAATDAPSATTAQTTKVAQACLCDLTPNFCDIGCCCDTADCDTANLTTVFTGCPQDTFKGACLEKWLMYRANIDSSLVRVTDTLFCVQPEAAAAPLFAIVPPKYPVLGDSYHFSTPAQVYIRHSRDFYRVDDVIQTFFSTSSVRGLLRQPSPGAASSFCFNKNPARFLRSTLLSCTRLVTPQSCITDPHLSARSYFSDMSLLKIPTGDMVIPQDLLIPVTRQARWPEPAEQNHSCINVVKKVEFHINYTGRGHLVRCMVSMELGNLTLDQMFLQTHSVQFQLAPPRPTPAVTAPAVGLKDCSQVIGHFDGDVLPLTTLGLSQGGECSPLLSERAPVLFPHNIISGCTFSSSAVNCTELRMQIYEVLQGVAAPDMIAMNSGSRPDWTRVIVQQCPISPQEICESSCVLPHSLSIQVLWARQGFIEVPQKYILGAKFLFHCQTVKCPLLSPLILTTKVAFADSTLYREPPRGLPQPHWKFPFDFFTRGTAELDRHIFISSSSEKVTLSLMLFTVLMLTGLVLFSR